MNKCRYCGYSSIIIKRFRAHVKRHEEQRSYSCVLCKKEYTKDGLATHWRNIHSDAKFVCQNCDFETNSAVRLGSHIERFHMIHKCDKCDHISSTSITLKIHQSNKHEGKRFKCAQCDYKATQKGNLAIHRESMHDGIIHNCDLCDYKSSTTRSMIWHKKAKHANST